MPGELVHSMNRESANGDQIPFNDPEAVFAGFGQDDIVALAYAAGDFLLAIDEHHIVRDIAVNVRDHGFAVQWIGQRWSDTVTVESRPKISQLLDADYPARNVWRQVNHPHDGDDIPIGYRVIKPAAGPWHLAVGRDMRAVSSLQQRLLKTQQSMERDYLHLRQVESRYRLLFDNIAYPVLIAEADTHHVQQANHACHALFGAAPGSLDGRDVLTQFDPADRSAIIAYFGAVGVNPAVAPVRVRLAGRSDAVNLAASAFRQSGRQYWLVNLDDGTAQAPASHAERNLLDVIEQMPDAFVLADEKQMIVAANRAFAELVQASSIEQLFGTPLGRFIGRADVDLTLLRKQLRDHQQVRNFASVVHDLGGGEEPVEISALRLERDSPVYGFSLRSIGRRERELPATGQQFPRSVEQLTELVGRRTLKEIVRESTDLIERMCIEAALIHTADNRASAAEILGLSRQSLYSKLHRHGLGNLVGTDKPD
jgi:transcriptional regulator PpsR